MKDGQVIIKETFQLGRFYSAMFKQIPAKEARQIQMNKLKSQEIKFHNPFKKWFKK